jgi:hypothetical protein
MVIFDDATKAPRGAAATAPTLLQQIYKAVDPKGQMTEAQRVMASYSALWQYHMRRGQLNEANKAAFGLLQVHRHNTMRYAALVRAADQGHLDGAAQFAAKAFVNVPNGKDVRITNEGGRLVYNAVDDRTGEVIRKGIFTPQEIGAWVMQTDPTKFDEYIHEFAGVRMLH